MRNILTISRTHRERKELYIKALEQEVIRLKESFSSVTKERDAFADENRRLKELLMAHGIAFDTIAVANGRSGMNSSYGASSAGSVSGYNTGSNSTGYTSPPTMNLPIQSQPQQVPQMNSGLDYDQIGIDFVLTYDHRTPYLSPPPLQ